jgi:hypothetical protein
LLAQEAGVLKPGDDQSGWDQGTCRCLQAQGSQLPALPLAAQDWRAYSLCSGGPKPGWVAGEWPVRKRPALLRAVRDCRRYPGRVDPGWCKHSSPHMTHQSGRWRGCRSHRCHCLPQPGDRCCTTDISGVHSHGNND